MILEAEASKVDCLDNVLGMAFLAPDGEKARKVIDR